MTIDEAIVSLSLQEEQKRQRGKQDQAEALKLCIEALKRVKSARLVFDPCYDTPLPGETKE